MHLVRRRARRLLAVNTTRVIATAYPDGCGNVVSVASLNSAVPGLITVFRRPISCSTRGKNSSFLGDMYVCIYQLYAISGNLVRCAMGKYVPASKTIH